MTYYNNTTPRNVQPKGETEMPYAVKMPDYSSRGLVRPRGIVVAVCNTLNEAQAKAAELEHDTGTYHWPVRISRKLANTVRFVMDFEPNR